MYLQCTQSPKIIDVCLRIPHSRSNPEVDTKDAHIFTPRCVSQALGNHEFDNAIPGLVPFMRNVSFPLVSANIDATAEPEVAALLAPSAVLTVGGEKIGVIGYTTKNTPILSYPGKLGKIWGTLDQKVLPTLNCMYEHHELRKGAQ